jgi:peroxiredoxin
MAARFREQGCEPVAVGVTATFSQLAFAEQLGIDFPLLSDWEGEAAARFGVRYDSWLGHSGLAKRSVFVIDRDRTIRYRWVTDDALELPDLGEALAAASAIG